ncbi:exodeoxyribonuclease III [Leptospira ryugenii]|uniref:Exodeoxyribonuclease III n=1 Tax=Leptospira ryugenii TaxID=1917863 RepID=A0A2P2DX58_9LEPT|nr:exodeoxyribonuclease III [Leptospira ryugenii]GBF49217.1 exodeoxyribonuclease III [Leptospira ryugenii]
MKILTLNCNGIRSAESKGLWDLIHSENPDIIGFQETKAPASEILKPKWEEMGYLGYICLAEKPGYSGVAFFVKEKPSKAQVGYGDGRFSSEGRSILLEYPKYLIWNLYFPSGTSGEERQTIKYEFLDQVLLLSQELRKKKKPLLLMGDVNIAHQEMDIHNPKANAKNSGFLPEERAWLGKFLAEGFIDFYRMLEPNQKTYTWWSYRANARQQNKGWRIDYIFGSEHWKGKAKRCYVKNEPILSDHAPLVLELQMP